MSLKAMIWVMEDAPVESHTELVVLYALADRAHDDGTAAWPSQDWIAERARCSTRTVRRGLAGRLSREGREGRAAEEGGDGGGRLVVRPRPRPRRGRGGGRAVFAPALCCCCCCCYGWGGWGWESWGWEGLSRVLVRGHVRVLLVWHGPDSLLFDLQL